MEVSNTSLTMFHRHLTKMMERSDAFMQRFKEAVFRKLSMKVKALMVGKTSKSVEERKIKALVKHQQMNTSIKYLN